MRTLFLHKKKTKAVIIVLDKIPENIEILFFVNTAHPYATVILFS